MLAGVDEAHETLSGPAAQKILYREFYDFGDQRYARLAAISVAPIYNLRKSRAYRDKRIFYQKTGLLRHFPFRIRGFHSDNGREFINHTVAKLLHKLLVEQTKSRPRHAQAIEAFYEQSFNPYLNFHRPCGTPEIRTNAKGQQRRVYRWYVTPWEMLPQLPDLAHHLREEVTSADLERMARAESDTEAVCRTPAEENRVRETTVTYLKSQIRKEACQRIASLPPPGSFFD